MSRLRGRIGWPSRPGAATIRSLTSGFRTIDCIGLPSADFWFRTAMFRGIKRIHLVGIGGIGMSGIAEILLHLGEGIQVTGSDLRRSAITDRLAQLGAAIVEGHCAINVEG